MTNFWDMVDFYKCMSSKHNAVLEIKVEQSVTVSVFTSLQSEAEGRFQPESVNMLWLVVPAKRESIRC